jgi:hypothetical protein
VVTSDVLANLLGPKIGVSPPPVRLGVLRDLAEPARLRDIAMPEVTIDKDRDSLTWEGDIRPARDLPLLNSEPATTRVQRATQTELGTSITGTNGGHYSRGNLRISRRRLLGPPSMRGVSRDPCSFGGAQFLGPRGTSLSATSPAKSHSVGILASQVGPRLPQRCLSDQVDTKSRSLRACRAPSVAAISAAVSVPR